MDAQEKLVAKQFAECDERARVLDDKLLVTQEEKAVVLKDLLKANALLQRLQSEVVAVQGAELHQRNGRLRAKAPIIPLKKRLKK